MTDLTNKTTQESTTKEVGVFDTIQAGLGTIGAAIKGFTSMGMVYIAAMALCVLGVLFCVGKVLLSPAGQKAINKGMNKGLDML